MRLVNPNGSSNCSVEGASYTADAANAVDVSWGHAQVLLQHGFEVLDDHDEVAEVEEEQAPIKQLKRK